MNEHGVVLIAAQDAAFCERLTEQLRVEGYGGIAVPDGESALREIAAHQPTMVVLDLRHPAGDGIQWLQQFREWNVPIMSIGLTDIENIATVVRAKDLGAFDVLLVDSSPALLAHAVRRAEAYREAVLPEGQSSEERYRLLFDASRDAIITMEPPFSAFASCNRACAEMFELPHESGCTSFGPAELSPDRQPDGRLSKACVEEITARAMRDGSASFEWRHRRLGGSEFPASVLLTRVGPPGGEFLLATVRDITAQKVVEETLETARAGLELRVTKRTDELAHINCELGSQIRLREEAEAELRHVNRMLQVLSECNQLIVHVTDEGEFLGEVCDILVRTGGYAMVWIGLVDTTHETTLRCAAQSGFDTQALEGSEVRFNLNEDGTATCTKATNAPGTLEARVNEVEDPWSAQAVARGCRSQVAIPLCVDGLRCGVLNIYSQTRGDTFSAEQEMLKKLASDLGSAVGSLRARQLRRCTQERIVSLSSLKERLLSSLTLSEKLKQITDGVVAIFGAEFARIWIMGDGDRCGEGCAHAGEVDGARVCTHRDRCLHLMASSGIYTHLDGAHGRVPLGAYKIGRIASGEVSAFITNDVQHDVRVHNHAWAKELGLISFAGWRLLSPDGTPIGVLALFSRHAISADDARLLEDLASTTSHVILAAFAANAVQESESKLHAVFHGCPIPQFAIDKHHRVVYWNHPLEKISGILQQDIVGTSDHWRACYSSRRPCLADYLVDGSIDAMIRAYPSSVRPSDLGVEAYDTTVLVTGQDGTQRCIHATAAVIRDVHGAIMGAVETLNDITELRRAEMELRQSRDELELRVQDRTKQLAHSNESLQLEIERRRESELAIQIANDETERLMASMSSFLIALDSNQCVTRWNGASEQVFGIPASEIIGKSLRAGGIPWDWVAIERRIPTWPDVQSTIRLNDVPYMRSDGSGGFLSLTIDAIRGDSGLHGCFLLGMDVSDRRALEIQLLHAQKLESVGRLAAGIAHEINTPIQYVGDNLDFLQNAFRDIIETMAEFRARATDSGGDTANSEVRSFEQESLDYVVEQIPQAIEQAMDGISRVASIVQAMKEFSHPGAEEKTSVDINQCIRSTIMVSRNEWKYVADMDEQLEEALPLVLCLPSEFNQVILNMIVNAAHAIQDLGRPAEEKGRIGITTRRNGDWIEIAIRDSGCGIPEVTRARIFDPFFTTKEVGRGTGQGLAIARHVVVEKLQGSIALESSVGEGSTFIVRLPIDTAPRSQPETRLTNHAAGSAL